MATWKKVIVSGSGANLATLQVDNLTSGQVVIGGGSASNLSTTAINGTGNIVATTGASGLSHSGSFSGSFQGDGSNLTGVTATAIFPPTSQTTLATTDKVYINDGSNKYATVSQFNSSSWTGVSGDITITNLGVAAIGTGKVTSTMILDGTITNTDINASAGIVYTKLNLASSNIVSGSSQITYSGLTGIPSGIVSASVLAAGSGQGSTTLTTNGVSSGDVTATGLGTSGTPTFAGLTISTNALAVNNTNGITTNAATFPIANTNATTINLGGAATAINIGASTGTTTINNDTRIKGTLYVDGPVTAISSSNLYVADQFILMASGSAGNTDGGIIIDRGSYAAGNIAFGYDATTTRWGFQDGLVDTTNAIDPTANSGVSGSFVPYLFTEASHGATKPITGEFAVVGSMYMSTAGDFWIYTA
jgi:hypothetical protein